jgi:hypothetical protein
MKYVGQHENDKVEDILNIIVYEYEGIDFPITICQHYEK